MSYLRCLCLLTHSGVQHSMCDFVLFFLRLVCPMLSVSLDVFGNVYKIHYSSLLQSVTVMGLYNMQNVLI
jgi:hypothetical protein